MLFKIALTFFVIFVFMLVVGILGGFADKESSTYSTTYNSIGGVILILTILFAALGCIGLIWF